MCAEPTVDDSPAKDTRKSCQGELVPLQISGKWSALRHYGHSCLDGRHSEMAPTQSSSICIYNRAMLIGFPVYTDFSEELGTVAGLPVSTKPAQTYPAASTPGTARTLDCCACLSPAHGHHTLT